MNQRSLSLLLVGIAVGLNLLSAVILKETADLKKASFLLITVLIILVIFINLLRVIFWSAIHKRFRLSDSYPLTSLFFPMILVLSIFYGEEIGIFKVIGTALITFGLMILMSLEKPQSVTNEP